MSPPLGETAPVRVLELRSTSGQGGGPERAMLVAAASSDAHDVEEQLCFLRRRAADDLWVHRRALELGARSHVVEERSAGEPRTLGRLRRLVRAGAIDVVHAHDYKADFYALLLSRLEPVLPVATAHGWPVRTLRERFLYYAADRRLLARFPLVFAVAADVRDRLLRSGLDPSRIELLPNAVDAGAFRPDAEARSRIRREWGIGEAERVVGTVGRLDPEKRPALLLEAFAAVAREHPEARLVVAGAGSRRAYVEAAARRLGLLERCRFLGFRADAEDVHRGFDVFVQASDTEASPYSLLEAMASATPVVATAVGETPSLLREGADGLVVPPGDARALARAIAAVLRDVTAARMRAAAVRARVVAERSLEARRARIAQRYRELLAGRAGTQRLEALRTARG